jgi:hypothetical protein
MNIEQLTVEFEKLQFHVKLLGEALDHRNRPVESLVLSLNWSEADLDKAHDIFEEYDMKPKEDINWKEFERALCEQFGINYQTVKSIVLAFFDNHQWNEVCHGYAMSFEPTTPIEFHRITRG